MNSYKQIINEALSHLKKPKESEIKCDLKEAEKYKGNPSVSDILVKYNSGKVLLRTAIENYLFDICNKLKSIKPDFISILKIYNILNDPYKKYILQSYFVFKDNKKPLNISTNDLIKLEIKIRLKYLYDSKEYYTAFIQKMLFTFKIIFEDLYIGQNILASYSMKTAYDKNFSDFCKCLKNIEDEFERLIKCHINSLLNGNAKMDLNSYKRIVRRAKLENDDILFKLYNECKSNEEIYYSIKKLKSDTYFELECILYDYLETFKLNGQINELKSQNKEIYGQINELNIKVNGLEEQNSELNGHIDELKSQNNEIKSMNNELNIKVNGLEGQNSELNDQIDELKTNLNSVTKKVNFMEIIVNSSLSRKLINHCIIEIIKKYRNIIKITLKDQDNFEISFEGKVGNVSAENANNLIKFLFSKKDILNNNVHFFQINKPDFIKDIWTEFYEFIELKDDNLINFNMIVTQDIKNSFKFSQKDQGISSFLKSDKALKKIII